MIVYQKRVNKQQRIEKQSVREHIFVFVFVAKGDIKLHKRLEKEVFFNTFWVEAVWFKVGKKGLFGCLSLESSNWFNLTLATLSIYWRSLWFSFNAQKGA